MLSYDKQLYKSLGSKKNSKETGRILTSSPGAEGEFVLCTICVPFHFLSEPTCISSDTNTSSNDDPFEDYDINVCHFDPYSLFGSLIFMK